MVTPEQIAKIKQLRNEGASGAAIAFAVGVSENTVWRHLREQSMRRHHGRRRVRQNPSGYLPSPDEIAEQCRRFREQDPRLKVGTDFELRISPTLMQKPKGIR